MIHHYYNFYCLLTIFIYYDEELRKNMKQVNLITPYSLVKKLKKNYKILRFFGISYTYIKYIYIFILKNLEKA